MSKKKSKPTIFASINAADGHGKTSWLLTMPKPMSLFHIDANTEQVVDKAIEDGTIDEGDVTLYPMSYPAAIFGNKDRVQDEAEKIWQGDFLDPLEKVLDGNDHIAIDTGTELFELLMMARHGRTIQIMPEMRTKMNYEFKSLLQVLKRSQRHVVLLHRVRDVWATTTKETNKGSEEIRDKVAGVFEREGFGKVGYHVNVEAYLKFDPSRGGTMANQFGMRVSRCTERASLATAIPQDKEFWDLESEGWWWGRKKLEDGSRVKRASFTYLAMQMYPGTTPEDWA